MVVKQGGLVGERLPGDHVEQVRVTGIDTGVDHGNLDAGPGELAVLGQQVVVRGLDAEHGHRDALGGGLVDDVGGVVDAGALDVILHCDRGMDGHADQQTGQDHQRGEGWAPQAHDLPCFGVGGHRAAIWDSGTPRSNSSTQESGTVATG